MAKQPTTCPLDDETLVALGFIPDANGEFRVTPNNELPAPKVGLSGDQPPQVVQRVSGVTYDEPEATNDDVPVVRSVA